MLFLLSPSKAMLKSGAMSQEVINYKMMGTSPIMLNESMQLCKVLANLTIEELQKDLGVSYSLASLNYRRYQDILNNAGGLSRNLIKLENACPSIFLYRGDLYFALSPEEFSKKDMLFLNHNFLIISAFYGLLKPLDVIMPYRLEMNHKVSLLGYKNLYEFWSQRIQIFLNQVVVDRRIKTIINLASDQYFKVIPKGNICAKIVNITFKEKRNGDLVNIGIMSKKARGLCSQFVVRNQVKTLDELAEFNYEGYRLHERTNSDLLFVR